MTRSDSGDVSPIGQGAIAPAAPNGLPAILTLVTQTVTEMLRDEDQIFASPLTPETLLVADLDYKSLDIVMLIGYLNRQLHLTDIPFERLLFVHGRPVADLSLQALADFMWEQTQAKAEVSEAGAPPLTVTAR
jgi:acyl carrier protein